MAITSGDLLTLRAPLYIPVNDYVQIGFSIEMTLLILLALERGTFSRRAKYQQEIEAMSGKYVRFVLQDFHATILAANLTASVALAGRTKLNQRKKSTSTSHENDKYQINFAQAFAN